LISPLVLTLVVIC